MKNVDELYNMTVAQVLRFHGMTPYKCPMNPCHDLTVTSGRSAVCHSCGIEWDAISLYFDLDCMETAHGAQTSVPDIETVDSLEEPDGTLMCQTPDTVQRKVDITDDFVAWVRANLQHIGRTPHYDRDHANAIGFVTLKGNLCLLPCVTDSLTLTQIRLLEEEWQQTNVIYPPSTGRGIKRPERVPLEIRKAHSYSSITKVYTFHRRETAVMLELEIAHPVRPVVSSKGCSKSA